MTTNNLSPYLPYISECVPFLSVENDNVACGKLNRILAKNAGFQHGCNVCKLSTGESSCLFNQDDPLYQAFQEHLRTKHCELFL